MKIPFLATRLPREKVVGKRRGRTLAPLSKAAGATRRKQIKEKKKQQSENGTGQVRVKRP